MPKSSLKKQKQNKTKKQNTKDNNKRNKTATTLNSSCSHHRWRCYPAIALNDEQIGHISLALLSS